MQTARLTHFFVGSLFFILTASGISTAIAATPHAVTLPMQLEQDRPYVDLTLTGAHGRSATGRFYLDTGGGAIILSRSFAERLGLKPTGKTFREGRNRFAPTAVPAIDIGGMRVALTDARALIGMDHSKMMAHHDAVGAFPVRMLRAYHVIFDYPSHHFTVAEVGAVAPQGPVVKTWIGKMGMPVVTLKVGGQAQNLLLDTGGSYCMMSAALLERWGRAHPDWPLVPGAYGPANMLLGAFEPKLEMMRIGTLQWGPFLRHGIGAVSRPPGTYEKWMSGVVGKPIVGSVGGNLLRSFRVDIDYPKGQVYLEGPKTSSGTHVDMVGIMIEPEQGGYVVAARVPGLKQLRVGDKLLGVDDLDAGGATLTQLMTALQGKPGSSHELRIMRDGKILKLTAEVQRIL